MPLSIPTNLLIVKRKELSTEKIRISFVEANQMQNGAN